MVEHDEGYFLCKAMSLQRVSLHLHMALVENFSTRNMRALERLPRCKRMCENNEKKKKNGTLNQVDVKKKSLSSEVGPDTRFLSRP